MSGTGSAPLRDAYEERYSAEGAASERYGRWRALCAEGKADHVERLARRLPEPPRAVIEVGCGDGALLAALGRRGVGVQRDGFDISERAVAIAGRRAEVRRAERFDGLTLPVAERAYDLAVLSHVLEHVEDPLPLLRETARCARAVIVEVPLEDNRSASRPAARRGREEIGHLHRFARADVRALAGEAGLAVEADLADPLPRAVHLFWAEGVRGTAAALAKAGLRRAAFALAPRLAERGFTVHYACLLRPA